jgi:hypothetical protein
LLYTTGTTTNSAPGTTQLTALAYDGTGVAPVADIAVGDGSDPVVLIDGRVATVENATTDGTSARLVTWAMGVDGRWARLDESKLPGTWATLRRMGGLVLAETGNAMAFLRPVDGGWAALGHGPRPCGFWGDWASGDAGADAVVWLPRGDSGLVSIAPWPTSAGR